MTSGVGLAVGGKRSYKRRYKKMASTWYNKKYSVGDIASKAWSGVKMIKDMINVETHTVDVSHNGTTVDYNGNLQLLNPVAQGDTRVNRQGKSIKGKSLSGRGVITIGGGTNNTVRLMIIQDTMNLGTDPTMTDVLETIGSTAAPFSNINQLANGRFKILWSRTLNINAVSTYSQVFKYYLPLSSHQYYDGAASTNNQKNSLYLCTISDVVTTNLPIITSYNRYSFYDN